MVAGVAVAVVYVGGWLWAAVPVLEPGALVAVSAKDSGADLRPVAGKR